MTRDTGSYIDMIYDLKAHIYIYTPQIEILSCACKQYIFVVGIYSNIS